MQGRGVASISAPASPPPIPSLRPQLLRVSGVPAAAGAGALLPRVLGAVYSGPAASETPSGRDLDALAATPAYPRYPETVLEAPSGRRGGGVRRCDAGSGAAGRRSGRGEEAGDSGSGNTYSVALYGIYAMRFLESEPSLVLTRVYPVQPY